MCFTRFITHSTTAWLFGALVQAAFAEGVQPNMAVQTLVPQVDPANTNVVTGIAVSYPAASTTCKSSCSRSGSINSEEGYETEVPSLYTTTITTRSTKTGTETVESFVSRSLTSSSSPPLQLEADSTAAATVTPTPTTSKASSGQHRFIPSAWRSYQSEKSKSAATATKMSAKETTGEATPSPSRDLRGGPVDLAPPECEDEYDSGSDTETPRMPIVFGAAALAIAVQAGMVFGAVPR